MATFRKAGDQKQGGNVASYFCTPGGRVLHLIPGPVDAEAMLREARWVVENWKLAQLEGHSDLMRLQTFFRKAHMERLRREYHINPGSLPAMNYGAFNPTLAKSARARSRVPPVDQRGQVHLLLTANPLPRLEQVYRHVFERILNERLSTVPVVEKG